MTSRAQCGSLITARSRLWGGGLEGQLPLWLSGHTADSDSNAKYSEFGKKTIVSRESQTGGAPRPPAMLSLIIQ